MDIVHARTVTSGRRDPSVFRPSRRLTLLDIATGDVVRHRSMRRLLIVAFALSSSVALPLIAHADGSTR